MAGVIDTVGSASGSPCGVSSSSAVAQSERSFPVATAQPIRNPQIIHDPTVGFITRYVNMSSGQIVNQSPSAVVVAYLRQGLSPDGSPKDHAPQPLKTV